MYIEYYELFTNATSVTEETVNSEYRMGIDWIIVIQNYTKIVSYYIDFLSYKIICGGHKEGLQCLCVCALMTKPK